MTRRADRGLMAGVRAWLIGTALAAYTFHSAIESVSAPSLTSRMLSLFGTLVILLAFVAHLYNCFTPPPEGDNSRGG